MKIIIAIPTRSSKDPLIELGNQYLKKCRYPIVANGLFVPPSQNKVIEEQNLLSKTNNFYRIALTERGKNYSSVDFAYFLNKLIEKESKIAFIIGGAFGLGSDILNSANANISLSPLTMPHRMAYLVLAEQIYRASEIIKGTPYHK